MIPDPLNSQLMAMFPQNTVKLPPGYRPATPADIPANRPLKPGTTFYVLGAYWPVYQYHQVTERTTTARLQEFIKDNRVFIRDKQTELTTVPDLGTHC